MKGEQMQLVRACAIALCLSANVVATPLAWAQDVAIEIDPADLAALGACTTADDCALALQALIARYAGLYPGVDISTIAASVATEVASAYSNGTMPGSAAGNILTALAATPGIPRSLASMIVAAANLALTGQPIDIVAIASASASAG